MDVTFFESQLFFSSHLQGESLEEYENNNLRNTQNSGFITDTEHLYIIDSLNNQKSNSKNTSNDSETEQGVKDLIVYKRRNQTQRQKDTAQPCSSLEPKAIPDQVSITESS